MLQHPFEINVLKYVIQKYDAHARMKFTWCDTGKRVQWRSVSFTVADRRNSEAFTRFPNKILAENKMHIYTWCLFRCRWCIGDAGQRTRALLLSPCCSPSGHWNERFRTRSGVSHLLSRQMIHSEEATKCAEACTATIFGSTGVNRASRISSTRAQQHQGSPSSAPLSSSGSPRRGLVVTTFTHDELLQAWLHTPARRTSHVLNGSRSCVDDGSNQITRLPCWKITSAGGWWYKGRNDRFCRWQRWCWCCTVTQSARMLHPDEGKCEALSGVLSSSQWPERDAGSWPHCKSQTVVVVKQTKKLT